MGREGSLLLLALGVGLGVPLLMRALPEEQAAQTESLAHSGLVVTALSIPVGLVAFRFIGPTATLALLALGGFIAKSRALAKVEAPK